MKKILVKHALILSTLLYIPKNAIAEYSAPEYTIGGPANCQQTALFVATPGSAPLARVKSALLQLASTIRQALAKAEYLGLEQEANGGPHYTSMPTEVGDDNGDNGVSDSPYNILSSDMANKTGTNNTGIVAAEVFTSVDTNIPKGTITFKLKFSDVAGIGDFADDTLISFRPALNSSSTTNKTILDWQCISSISWKRFSRSQASPDGSTLTLDPILNGLGYPFNGCVTSKTEATNDPPLLPTES